MKKRSIRRLNSRELDNKFSNSNTNNKFYQKKFDSNKKSHFFSFERFRFRLFSVKIWRNNVKNCRCRNKRWKSNLKCCSPSLVERSNPKTWNLRGFVSMWKFPIVFVFRANWRSYERLRTSRRGTRSMKDQPVGPTSSKVWFSRVERQNSFLSRFTEDQTEISEFVKYQKAIRDLKDENQHLREELSNLRKSTKNAKIDKIQVRLSTEKLPKRQNFFFSNDEKKKFCRSNRRSPNKSRRCAKISRRSCRRVDHNSNSSIRRTELCKVEPHRRTELFETKLRFLSEENRRRCEQIEKEKVRRREFARKQFSDWSSFSSVERRKGNSRWGSRPSQRETSLVERQSQTTRGDNWITQIWKRIEDENQRRKSNSHRRTLGEQRKTWRSRAKFVQPICPWTRRNFARIFLLQLISTKIRGEFCSTNNNVLNCCSSTMNKFAANSNKVFLSSKVWKNNSKRKKFSRTKTNKRFSDELRDAKTSRTVSCFSENSVWRRSDETRRRAQTGRTGKRTTPRRNRTTSRRNESQRSAFAKRRSSSKNRIRRKKFHLGI